MLKQKSCSIILQILVLSFLISCRNSNYDKIKPYFSKTEHKESKYRYSCEVLGTDTLNVIEDVKLSEDKIYYSLVFYQTTIDFIFSPKTYEVLRDSNKGFSICEKEKYIRTTDSLFIKPEFQRNSGMYREYNGENDSLSKEYNWWYPYRIYFTFEEENLILHRDFEFKTELNLSFYFSKNKGLYKVVTGPLINCDYYKIEQ